MCSVAQVSALWGRKCKLCMRHDARQFLEKSKVLRFLGGIVICCIRRAQMRDVFVLVGHGAPKKLVSAMRGGYGGERRRSASPTLRFGFCGIASATCRRRRDMVQPHLWTHCASLFNFNPLLCYTTLYLRVLPDAHVLSVSPISPHVGRIHVPFVGKTFTVHAMTNDERRDAAI